MDKLKNNDFHHYCILRDDLPLGVSHAQLLHAAAESNPDNKSCYAVVLSTSREHLLDIEKKLCDLEIGHKAIRESDAPYNGDLTAIGICPLVKSKSKDFRRIVAGIKLLR